MKPIIYELHTQNSQSLVQSVTHWQKESLHTHTRVSADVHVVNILRTKMCLADVQKVNILRT